MWPRFVCTSSSWILARSIRGRSSDLPTPTSFSIGYKSSERIVSPFRFPTTCRYSGDTVVRTTSVRRRFLILLLSPSRPFPPPSRRVRVAFLSQPLLPLNEFGRGLRPSFYGQRLRRGRTVSIASRGRSRSFFVPVPSEHISEHVRRSSTLLRCLSMRHDKGHVRSIE